MSRIERLVQCGSEVRDHDARTAELAYKGIVIVEADKDERIVLGWCLT